MIYFKKKYRKVEDYFVENENVVFRHIEFIMVIGCKKRDDPILETVKSYCHKNVVTVL